MKRMQGSDVLNSPNSEYLQKSGFGSLRKFGSRNNSPTEIGKSKVNVISSNECIRFNISLEEDKLKSIRRKAKNQGLFIFDPAKSIRKVANLQLQEQNNDFSKSLNLSKNCKHSPNVSHGHLESTFPKRKKVVDRSKTKAQSFI
jgi:hypothetical protein